MRLRLFRTDRSTIDPVLEDRDATSVRVFAAMLGGMNVEIQLVDEVDCQQLKWSVYDRLTNRQRSGGQLDLMVPDPERVPRPVRTDARPPG